MKKIVFIGSYDKTDMLIYVAKILTLMGKKVIFIDTTLLKKSRYIVPTMVQEKKYITTYEDIDVAIGFENFEAIEQYQKNLGRDCDYDIALFDIDRAIAYQKFGLNADAQHFFVTSFDVYNLKRGLQVLAYIPKDAVVTKIYYTKSMLEEEDEYLNYLARDYKINWNQENIIFFPFETSDQNAIFTNQRVGRIQMKGISTIYVDSILYLVEDITGESSGKIRNAYKILDEY